VSTRTVYGYVRLAIALICLVALVARYFWALGFGAFTGVNFFGYLTIHSNIWFMAITLVAGVVALRRDVDPRWLTTLRAATLTATVTSGVVFAILMYVAHTQGTVMDVDWSDHVLHFILPPLAIAEWLATPGRGRAQWRSIFLILGYVVVWGVLTLVRGAFVDWYPYFFLDPNQSGGIAVEVGLCTVAMAFFAVIASAIIGLSVRTLPEHIGVLVSQPRLARAMVARL
jgi:hypothetical protein